MFKGRDPPLWLLVGLALLVALIAVLIAYAAFQMPWGVMD